VSQIFLLSWDNTGLESVIDIGAMEKEAVWLTLQDKNSTKIRDTVNAIMLRARYNSQRHYEIYTILVEDGISESDIREMFENDPQGSADLIRVRGNKLYSDRLNKEMQRIE
jgi:hypothetical protein